MLVHCRFYGRVHQVIVEMVGKVSKQEANSVPEEVFGYKEAETNGDRFYIAAEFKRGQLPPLLILGNGKIYRDYVNAPLQPETRYKAYLRGVTQHNGVSLSQSESFHYSQSVDLFSPCVARMCDHFQTQLKLTHRMRFQLSFCASLRVFHNSFKYNL